MSTDNMEEIPEVNEKERGIVITSVDASVPQVDHPNKRINVISKQINDENGKEIQMGGILMRTTRSYAAKLIATGTHTTTSKNKLKSFLNKSSKLYRNGKYIKKIGFDISNEQTMKKYVFHDPFNHKLYARVATINPSTHVATGQMIVVVKYNHY